MRDFLQGVVAILAFIGFFTLVTFLERNYTPAGLWLTVIGSVLGFYLWYAYVEQPEKRAKAAKRNQEHSDAWAALEALPENLSC